MNHFHYITGFVQEYIIYIVWQLMFNNIIDSTELTLLDDN